jgi:hypothetical protein
MIFIWRQSRITTVFFVSLSHTTVGDVMNKSGTLITSALLSLGLVAGAMAADMPKAADTPAAGATATPSTGTKTGGKKHHSKKKKPTTPSTAQ